MKILKNICLAAFAFLMTCCVSNTVSAAGGFEVTAVAPGEASTGAYARFYGFEGLSVQHRVVFHFVDDYADLVLTIKNSSPNLRTITDISDNNSNPFVSYSYDKHAGLELNPGDTFDFTIRITCIEDEVQDPSELTQTNNVAFNITFDEVIIEIPEPDIPTEPVGPTEPVDEPTGPATPAEPTEPAVAEQASIVTNTEELELTIPNTGLNTMNNEPGSENQAGVVIAVILISFGFVNAAIFAFRKRPRAAAALFAISLSGIVLVAPLSARAEDNVETLNLTSVIGVRKTLHIKMDAFLDGVSMPTGIDLDIPYEAILQMQQQSGMTITPAMLVDEALLYDIPPQFEVEKIEYSNGYDDEEIDPDAPLIDDLYAAVYVKTNLHQYSITYELNGGTMPASNPTSYTEMSNVVISNPTKEDYYFVGWTVPGIEETPQTNINFYGRNIIAAGFGDLHFVANWREARIFNITYDLNGGTMSTPNPDTYKEDTPGFTLNNPTKTDWVFTGWTLADVEGQPKKNYMVSDLEDDITLVANWKMVYITFSTDSRWASAIPGVPVENQRIRLLEDDEIIAPDGYWSNEDDNEWMLYFDAWYTSAWTKCTASGMGYVNCSGEPRYAAGDIIKAAGTLPENDIIVYPGYNLYDHAITYLLGDGGHFEGDYPATYNFFSEFDIPAPVREGYVFTGWKAHGLIMHHLAHYHAHWAEGLIGINRGPVTIEALWEEAKTMDEFEYIQDVNYGNCVATPVGTAVTLKDKRDEKSYRIKRLEDGRCWFVDNLSITGVTLTSDDSDIAEGTTFTLPESDIGSVSRYWAQPAYVGAYDDPTYGGYYTFNAATAGSGATIGSNEGESAPYSICPKNWKLPSGPKQYKGKEEYTDLFDFYSDRESILNSNLGPNFILNGYADGEIYYPGTSGHYWTSTSDSSRRKEAYTLNIYDNPDSFNHGYWSTERLYGAAVRCYLWD